MIGRLDRAVNQVTCNFKRYISLYHQKRPSQIKTRYWPHQRQLRQAQRRPLAYDAVFAVLQPPAIFAGLVVSLWAYKCLMMVVFQNKIIYMPSIPPFSRSEKLSEYCASSYPVVWSEHNIKSLDGTRLALCVGEIHGHERQKVKPNVNVLYFQGNGSSLPPRLPILTPVLKAFAKEEAPLSLRIVVLSYRGYWKSEGRPSEAGIRYDSVAAHAWMQHRYGSRSKTVLWGQSLGAAVAARLAATTPDVSGLVLETPFISIRSMLVSLYPQKWLPYRYLWPFLRNRWDNADALRALAKQHRPPKLLIMTAEHDEVVPSAHSAELFSLAKNVKLDVRHVFAYRALHHEVMNRKEGRIALNTLLQELALEEMPREK